MITFTFSWSQKVFTKSLSQAQNMFLFHSFFFLSSTCFDIALLSLASPSTNHFLHLSNYRCHKSACPPCFFFQHGTCHASALNHSSHLSVSVTQSSFSPGFLFFLISHFLWVTARVKMLVEELLSFRPLPAPPQIYGTLFLREILLYFPSTPQ